jgi:hypothetical protein
VSTTNGGAPPPPERPPVPLVLSIAFGALGFVLLAAGLIGGSTGLAVAGFAAGSLSLGAALYWRSLLINSWAAQKRGRPRD